MTAARAEPQSGPGCPRPHTEATLASGRGGAEADTGWLTVRLSYIQVEKIIHIKCTKDKVQCSCNYHLFLRKMALILIIFNSGVSQSTVAKVDLIS